jgi:hypothetical protein
MAQSLVQSELFASQDWRVLYRAFTQVNFNASDPSSVAASMRDYIRANYPEDFNDWIETSEFVAYIDLLSWLAGSINFKQDINARENFLEIAEARESILRLARFLSYNPRRCQPARGLLKLIEITTDDAIYDTSGASLAGVPVRWNNSEDQNWYERFQIILNSALATPFGNPVKQGSVAGVTTHLYRVNGETGQNTLSFPANINGTQMPFEVCNGDFDDGGTFFERSPMAETPMHLFHRNDGAGNGSPKSGFFFLFKQGTLTNSTYLIGDPQPNRVLELQTTNVNDSDVWVQNVNDVGAVTAEWKKVPAIYSENITYNSFVASERNIFSVITRDNDRVSIRFSDGIFGNAPVGNIRVWTRASNGLQYSIRPSEMNRVVVPMTYINRRGVRCTLKMTLALQEPVTNAAKRESEEQIKRRAPSVFGTQNRMVSGEDYNVFPLSSNIIKKLKSVNRTYAGHSRYIDLNDPTGNYQNTAVFSDDGMIYEEPFNRYAEVPISFNRTPNELLLVDIQPMLSSEEVVYAAQRLLTKKSLDDLLFQVPAGCVWHSSSNATASGTGYFSVANNYFRVGAMLLFSYQRNAKTVTEWASIGGIQTTAIAPTLSTQRYGSVSLNAPIPEGATVLKVIPAFSRTIDSAAAAVIRDRIENKISFSLWFNPATGLWSVETGEALSVKVHDAARAPAFKVLNASYSGSSVWQLSANGIRLVFESEAAVKWFNDPSTIIDNQTGAKKTDLVRIIRINNNLKSTTAAGFDRDYDLNVTNLIQYGNGYAESSRVQVKLADSDADGQPDQPDLFATVVAADERRSRLFWRRAAGTSISGFKPYYGMTVYANEADRIADTAAKSAIDGDIVAYQIDAASDIYANTFWVMIAGIWVQETTRFKTALGRGANVANKWVSGASVTTTSNSDRDGFRINYQWKHYASSDHRIDPSPTNIHDMFVLTEEYDFAVRQWIANGADPVDSPPVPSELDLRLTFKEYDEFKMGSDVMVWRPVRYKFLFGPSSDATLRAQIKVVKLPSSLLSDGEIKSAIVKAINTYFSAEAWSFGDTFYASELSAYIHHQMVGSIASAELVPLFADSSFGDLQEIVCRSDELFVSTAQVSDVQIIGSNTPGNLRMR